MAANAVTSHAVVILVEVVTRRGPGKSLLLDTATSEETKDTSEGVTVQVERVKEQRLLWWAEILTWIASTPVFRQNNISHVPSGLAIFPVERFKA
jgi:hypothetical protein